MHALDQLARATREAHYNQWARELDATAFRAFTYIPAPPLPTRRMHWKMSVDLSRPLLASMGQHDPLDGYLTTLELRVTAASLAQAQGVRQQVVQQVFTSFYALQTATQRVSTSDDLLASAQQSEEVARGRYQEGVGTILDLLTAQNALADARTQQS